VDDALNAHVLSKNAEVDKIDLQSPMGIASSMKIKGKSHTSCQFSYNHTIPPLSLSLIESSSNVLAKPTMEEVISFGGISKASIGVSSSSRLESQHDMDMPQMEKAMRQKQLRDASCVSGNPTTSAFSIVNIPDDEISHRVNRLGISLGLSKGDVAKSIKGIKLLEEERMLTILQNNLCEKDVAEEVLSSLVMSKVSNLCEDLVEEDDILLGLEDHVENIKPVMKVKKSRQRKVYDTNNIRKSTRKRVKKQYS
jgi:hypothetical protein